MASIHMPRPRRNLLAHLACALTALLVSGAARAEDGAPADWSVSGFATLGAMRQQGLADRGLLRSSTQRVASASGSATIDSRLGLQLNWSPAAQWEAGIQGVLLSRPHDTPWQESIEWAWLGWRPTADSRIRLGRISADIFLFADSRNVGVAWPWVRPPVDFYGFSPIFAVDGIDLEQRWAHDDSTWRARLTAGRFCVSTNDTRNDRMPTEGRDIVAFGLTREAGGLLLKFSLMNNRTVLHTPPEFDQMRQGLAALAALPLPGVAQALDPLRQQLWNAGPSRYLALAAQYETGPWSLVAEGSRLSVPDSALDGQRGYLSLGWRQGNITTYGVASRVKPRRPAPATPDLLGLLTPALGAAAAQQAQVLAGAAAQAVAAYRYDQSTLGAGVRWDWSPQAALKLQLDRFQIHPNGAAGWHGGGNGAGSGRMLTLTLDLAWAP